MVAKHVRVPAGAGAFVLGTENFLAAAEDNESRNCVLVAASYTWRLCRHVEEKQISLWHARMNNATSRVKLRCGGNLGCLDAALSLHPVVFRRVVVLHLLDVPVDFSLHRDRSRYVF